MTTRVALMACALTIAGCADTYWTSNVRETMTLGPGQAIATNADIRLVHRFPGVQRVTVRTEPTSSGGEAKYVPVVVHRDYLCAEPSPDIARAVQASLGASGGLGASVPLPQAGGTPVEFQLAAQLSAARAESLAQLTKRIATIQLLRDGLYRACEAYANGAIGKEIYAAIISRYDRMMVTMLLAEMAAGHFGSAAVLTSHGTADASADAAASGGAAGVRAAQARDAWRREVERSAELAGRKQQVEAAIARRKAAGESTSVEDAELANLQIRITAQDKLEQQAKADLDTAAEAARQAQAAGAAAGAGGRASAAAAGSITDPIATTARDAGEVLHRMQRTYLAEPNGFSLLMMCFTELADPEPVGPRTVAFCDKIRTALLSDQGYALTYDTTARAMLTELGNERIEALGRALRDLIGSGKMTVAQATAILNAVGGSTTPPFPRR